MKAADQLWIISGHYHAMVMDMPLPELPTFQYFEMNNSLSFLITIWQERGPYSYHLALNLHTF